MKKKPCNPPGSASFRVPLYSGRVLICFTREACNAALEVLDGEPDPSLKEYAGATWELMEGTRRKRKVFMIGWFDKNLGTLVHELTHLTFLVLRHADVKISPTNDEAYAYLMDALYMGATKAARRVDKRGSLADAKAI